MKDTRFAAGVRATTIAVAAVMASGFDEPVLSQERETAVATSQPDVRSHEQEPPPEQNAGTLGSSINPEGATVWGTFLSYGFSQVINGSASDTDIGNAGLCWSHVWGEHFGGFVRGNPAFGIELLPMIRFSENERTTWGGGFNLLYEHRFSNRNRVRPVWKLGAGFLYANQEFPEGETRHNFSLLTDFGMDVMVSERLALFLGYRFQHVSNANTGDRNPGLNAHTMMFGLSLYR